MYKETARRRLREYLNAESAILAGQAYTIGDRVLQRADLKAVQAQIQSLLDELSSENGAGVGRKQVVFI